MTIPDSLLVASQYDPFSILQKLHPYLGGSASIVVQSPHVQILSDLQAKLRDIPTYLGPAVSEAWLRRYQVCLSVYRTRGDPLNDVLLVGVARSYTSYDECVWIWRLPIAHNQSVCSLAV